MEIGKAAITLELFPRENTDALFRNWIPKRQAAADKREDNWYDSLFGALCNGTPFDEVDKNKLSVITFNYDRSLEQYLFTALMNSYKKSEQECAEKLAQIPIVHVHGSLGRLPWQSWASDTTRPTWED